MSKHGKIGQQFTGSALIFSCFSQIIYSHFNHSNGIEMVKQ